MKKEVVLAISIGFIIGLILTFVFYRSKFDFGSSNEILSPIASNYTNQTQTQTTNQTQLTIISPLDQSIIQEAKTVISGKTSPLSWIVIMGEKGEKIIRTDNDGDFQTDLLLVSGENEIVITAINEQGNEISKTLTIVYSTVEI